MPLTITTCANPLQWVENTIGMRKSLWRKCTFHAQHVFQDRCATRGHPNHATIFHFGLHRTEPIASTTNDLLRGFGLVGVVLDLMIHDVGIAMALVDSPIERIDAIGVKVLSVTEDIANARLTFANGCVANLTASRVSEKKARECRVFQDSGYLSLDFMNQKGHLITKGASGLERSDVPVEKGEPLALELAEFARCVRLADKPKTDVDFGKSALEVALEITRLIEEGWES